MNAPARSYRPFACAVLVFLTASLALAGEAIDMKSLKTIWIPKENAEAEQAAAKVLQEGFQSLYGFRPAVVADPPVEGTPGIVLGRQLALASGKVSEAELEAAKYDGYVIKGVDNRVILTGYDRVGTRYAPAALLRRLGMRMVPWQGSTSGVIETAPKNPPAMLEPFVETDRPFYDYRDLMCVNRPEVFRTLYRNYRLNDPSKAANPELFSNPYSKRPANYTKYNIDKRDEWTGWCATAAYLMPRDLYYAEHPEYFAMYDGKRSEPTGYSRTAICESNPEGLKIALQRGLELVEMQKDRRYFHISQADTRMCACEDCLKANPLPDYTTDRLIAWVNAFAKPIRQRFPDKVVMTLAYMEAAKPPVKTRPEPNVSVMYCPWQWNSRATSHVSFDTPVNLTAAREFIGWTMWCPGQVSVYDYAYSDAVDGTADRIKYYARFGVRQIHFNGAKHERLLWLGSQLMWDPFQDIEPLNEQFVRLQYGPAAEPMGKLLEMEQEAIRRFVMHRRMAFEPQRHEEAPWWTEFCRKTRELTAAAEKIAASTDETTRIRILSGCCVAMQKVLAVTHPATGGPGLRATSEVYKQDLTHAGRLAQDVLAACQGDANRFLLSRYQEELAKPLVTMGLTVSTAPATASAEASAGRAEMKFDPQLDQGDRLGEGAGGAGIAAAPQRVTIGFDKAGEAGKWLADGTQANLIAPAEAAEIIGADGKALHGVRIDAPLSKLPVVPRGNITLHAGRFYLERVLDEPLKADGCHSISLHVHATRDVPVTFYTDAFRADVNLHAGEQIIRMDLRNFQGFDASKPQVIKSLALDIWPQDHFYPYPAAKDVSVTVLSLTAANREPVPADLPYAGKAIWLSAFRATVPNEPPYSAVAVPKENMDKLRRTKQTGNIDRYLPRGKERSRTWCSHRTLSPITAILTGGDAASKPPTEAVQRCLERAFGVRVPIDPTGVNPSGDTGNAILVGRKACLDAGRVTEQELAYGGGGGFALNAAEGRIALAGADSEGTAAAVERFLDDHGIRMFGAGTEPTADMKADFLHELYTLDKAWFASPSEWGRGWLAGSAPAEALPPGNKAQALRLAAAIKDLARAGKHDVPADLLDEAGKTTLSRYLARRLLRNPFEDASRSVRLFEQAGRN